MPSSARRPAPVYQAPAGDPIMSYSRSATPRTPRPIVVPVPPSPRDSLRASAALHRRDAKREQAWVSDFHATPVFSTYPREKSLLLNRAVAAVAADRASSDSSQMTPRTKLILSDVPFCISAGEHGSTSAATLEPGAPLIGVQGVTPREAQSVRRSRAGARATSPAPEEPSVALFKFGHPNDESYFTVQAVADAPAAAADDSKEDPKGGASTSNDDPQQEDDAPPPPALLWTVVEKPPVEKKDKAEKTEESSNEAENAGKADTGAEQPRDEAENEDNKDDDEAAAAEDPDPEADQANARDEAQPSWQVADAGVDAAPAAGKYIVVSEAPPGDGAEGKPSSSHLVASGDDVMFGGAPPAAGAMLKSLDGVWELTGASPSLKIVQASTGRMLTITEPAAATDEAETAPVKLAMTDQSDSVWTATPAAGGLQLSCGNWLLARGAAGDCVCLVPAPTPPPSASASDNGEAARAPAKEVAVGSVWSVVPVTDTSADAAAEDDTAAKKSDAAGAKGNTDDGDAAAAKDDAKKDKSKKKKSKKGGKKKPKKQYTVVLAPAGPYQAPPPKEDNEKVPVEDDEKGQEEAPAQVEDKKPDDDDTSAQGSTTKRSAANSRGDSPAADDAKKKEDDVKSDADGQKPSEEEEEEKPADAAPAAGGDEAAKEEEEKEASDKKDASPVPTAEQLWALHPMTATAKDGARLYFFTNKAHPKLYLCVGPDGAALKRRPPGDVGVEGNTLVRSRREVVDGCRHEPPKAPPKAAPAPPPARHALKEAESLEVGERLTSPNGEFWLSLTRAGQLRLESAEAGKERLKLVRRRMKEGPAASQSRGGGNTGSPQRKNDSSTRTPQRPATKQTGRSTGRNTAATRGTAQHSSTARKASPQPADTNAELPPPVWMPETSEPAGSLVLRGDGRLELLGDEADLADALWTCEARGEKLRLSDEGRLELLERPGRDRELENESSDAYSDDSLSASDRSSPAPSASSQASSVPPKRRSDEKKTKKAAPAKKKEQASGTTQEEDNDDDDDDDSALEVVWSVGVPVEGEGEGDDDEAKEESKPNDGVAAGAGPVRANDKSDGAVLASTANQDADNCVTTLSITDGNLVLLAKSDKDEAPRELWRAPVADANKAVDAVEMRNDGSFVATDAGGAVAWSTCTEGSTAKRAEVTHEELRLVDADGGLVWTMKAPPATAAAPDAEDGGVESAEEGAEEAKGDSAPSSPPAEEEVQATTADGEDKPAAAADDTEETKAAPEENSAPPPPPLVAPATAVGNLEPGEVVVSADGAWALVNHRHGGVALYGKQAEAAPEWAPKASQPGKPFAVADGALAWGKKGDEGAFVMPVPNGFASGAQITVTNGGWIHLARNATVL